MTHNHLRPDADVITKETKSLFTMLPDWVRDLFLWLATKIEALFRSAFPYFAVICLVISAMKLIGYVLHLWVPSSYLIFESLIIIAYGVSHLYHDAHAVRQCAELQTAQNTIYAWAFPPGPRSFCVERLRPYAYI